MLVDEAIRQRRSHKVFTGAPIADATLSELLGLAVWAPNHKFTEPWRFSVVRGPRLGELADRVLAVPGGKGAKLHDILRRAGAVVLVSYVRSPDDPVRDREDYAACACAMQNVMLGAVARGLGSYWTTSPALVASELADFWRLPAGESSIGAAVLGTPALDMPAVRHKSLADLTRWL
jgi:nitroreductase